MATTAIQTDFTTVTELPGTGATPETLSMLFTRYKTAADLSKGKDVLEVACGPGLGLGYLLQHAKSVTAGDYDPKIVALAQKHYGDRIDIRQIDAQSLPFEDGSFDVVLMLEALYFVPDAAKFMEEARRVLRPGGTLFVASPNKEFESFNPAPYSTRYFTASEYQGLFSQHGFTVEVKAGFPEGKRGLKSKIFSLIRKVAVSLHLIPKTMGGKEAIKRLLYGKLDPFPEEVDETTGEFHPFVPITPDLNLPSYKVLYAIGKKAT